MEALVERAQQGDRQAFAELLELHYERIYRFAFRWSGHRQDAEDIAQEVCIKLGRVIGSFRGESAFSSWLYRITMNVAKDHGRRRRPTHDDPDQRLANLPAGGPDPEATLMGRLILRCIELLPEGLRMAVLMVYGEGCNHRQAGEVLECAEGTISWRLSEARRQLATCMEKEA